MKRNEAKLTISTNGISVRSHNRRISVFEEDSEVIVLIQSVQPEKEYGVLMGVICRGHYRETTLHLSSEGAAVLGYAMSEYWKNKVHNDKPTEQ